MAGEDELQICGFCRKGKEVESICGELHVSKDCAAHHKCMQYSSGLRQWRFKTFGGFLIEDVQNELRRGRGLICHICKPAKKRDKKPHHNCATSGCALPRCRKTFHFYCVHQSMQQGGEAIYKRYVEVDEDDKVVKYRIFCSEQHQKEYEETDKWTGTDTEELSSDRSFPSEIEDFELSDEENSPRVVQQSRAKSKENKEKVLSKTRKSMKSNKGSDNSDSETDQAAMNNGRLAKKSNTKKLSSKTSTSKSHQKRKVHFDSAFESTPKKSKTRSFQADKAEVKQKSIYNGKPADTKQDEKGGKTAGITKSTKKVASSTAFKPKKKDGNVANDAHIKPGENDPTGSNHGEKGGETANVTKGTKKVLSSAASKPQNEDRVAANDVHIKPGENDTNETSKSASTSNSTSVGSRKKMQSSKTYPDCLLFFVEGSPDVNELTTQLINIADEEYTIDEKCVFNWQRCVPSSPLTTHQMLYYTKTISEALKNEWTNEIIRLICDLNGRDMLTMNVSLDYGNRLAKEIQKNVTDSVHKQIDCNFKEFNQQIGNEVASLYYMEDDDSFVTVIVLNKHTDSDGRIREFLLKENKTELFLWGDNNKLVPHSQYLSSDLEHFQMAEAEILYHELDGFIQDKLEVLCGPQDDIFTGSCKSVVYDWKQGLAATSDPDASTILMLFGPLDTQMVLQKAYYTKVLQHHVPEAVDAGKSVLCAIDVQNLQLNSVRDIIPSTLRDSAQVQSAFDPDMFPVTCLLLKFKGKHTPRKTRQESEKTKPKMASEKKSK